MGACEEILGFSKSYRGKDFIDKNIDVWSKYQSTLSEEEKKKIQTAFCEIGNLLLFGAFIKTMKVNLTPADCMEYMNKCFKASANDLRFLFFQKMICDGIDTMGDRVSSSDTAEFLVSMLLLSIRYDLIYVVQYIMRKEKLNTNEVTERWRILQNALTDQRDINVVELFNEYVENGSTDKDAAEFFDKYGAYRPRIYEVPQDYFASKGLEICRINLESYEKPDLLGDSTTLQELNDFIDNQYNWDDGVEIPYFIMHHKKCDLELRKKLFELGAGDCIDENTYKDTDKDPWKRFILELKEMIEKEEQ